jgi:hypothetical protein
LFTAAQGTASVFESTISGNNALQCGGGIYSKYELTVANSTVAFNRAYAQSPTRSCVGAGIYSGAAAKSVTLNSTIVSNNLGGADVSQFASDFDAPPGMNNNYNVVDGANNLVPVTDGGSRAPPAGTIKTDPKLLPLRGNGGPTQTHFPGAGSPAIDHGNNADHDATDQRGVARSLGAATDIGAVETNPDDIFLNGFD